VRPPTPTTGTCEAVSTDNGRRDEQIQVVRGLFPALVSISAIAAAVSSLGVPLIPTIASDNGISLSSAQWSLTIASLAAAVAGPAMGRLADGPRRRPVILAALSVVVVGNVLSALPLGFAWFLVGRALQGVGLGLTPLTIAVARDCFPTDRAHTAVATLSVTTVGGVGIGFPLVGLLADRFDLQTAFWFAAAMSLLALGAAALVVPSTASRRTHPFDARGAFLLAVSLAALLMAVSQGEVWGWTSVRLSVLVAVAVVTMTVWARHERRAAYPLVDLQLLRSRPVLTAAVVTVLSGIANYLLLSIIVRFIQTPVSAGYGFGSSVIVAGLALVPFSLMSVVAGRWLMPWIVRRTGAGPVLPVAAIISAIAPLLFLLHRQWLWEVLVVMAIAGVGIGLTFGAIPGLIISGVAPKQTGSAMSVNQVLRMAGFAVGSASSATLLAAYTPISSGLPSAGGYDASAIAGVGIWFCTAAASILLPRRAGADTRPDQRSEAAQTKTARASG